MKQTLPLIAAITVVLSSGVAQGIWAHRWIPSRGIEVAVSRLDNVPKVIGDWEGEDEELDGRQVEVGEIAGHISRRYRNRLDGSVVTLLLMCGRPGPIAVHSPEICYAGSGYELEEAPLKYHVEG